MILTQMLLNKADRRPDFISLKNIVKEFLDIEATNPSHWPRLPVPSVQIPKVNQNIDEGPLDEPEFPESNQESWELYSNTQQSVGQTTKLDKQ